MNKPLSTKEFIKRAKQVHGNLYNYSNTKYITSKHKIKIICPLHGEFHSLPLNHTFKKSGCPQCAPIKRPQSTPLSVQKFIQKAKKVHKDVYDYSLVEYVNSHTKVKILCPIHGMFLQTPVKHVSAKCGCSSCNKPSLGEQFISKFLENKKIKFCKEQTFGGCRNPLTDKLLKFDFYILSKNLVIEFDGEHHFKPTQYNGMSLNDANDVLRRTKKCDKIKNNFLKRNNINLIRLKYTLKQQDVLEVLKTIL